MSNVKGTHTPGPWSYYEETSDGIFKWSYTIESAVREFDERSNVLVVAHLTTGTSGEHESNARLIAAAPEMLEALVLYERDSLCLSGNEEGEEYTKCDVCGATEWGDTREDFTHNAGCRLFALAKARGGVE